MNASRQIKLGMFIRPCGHHIASWRHPDACADAGVNFRHMVEIAQTAERGLFDMIFSADTHSVWTAEEAGLHRLHYVAWIEPFALLPWRDSPGKSVSFARPRPASRNLSRSPESLPRSTSSAA